MNKLILALLIILHGLIGSISFYSGIRLAGNQLGVPLSFLEGTPFTSYLIPGIILTVVIGGTNLLSMFLLIFKKNYGIISSSVAGFGLIIWIFTEMYLITEKSFLQVLFFSLAILILILVLLSLFPRLKNK